MCSCHKKKRGSVFSSTRSPDGEVVSGDIYFSASKRAKSHRAKTKVSSRLLCWGKHKPCEGLKGDESFRLPLLSIITQVISGLTLKRNLTHTLGFGLLQRGRKRENKRKKRRDISQAQTVRFFIHGWLHRENITKKIKNKKREAKFWRFCQTVGSKWCCLHTVFTLPVFYFGRLVFEAETKKTGKEKNVHIFLLSLCTTHCFSLLSCCHSCKM